MRRNSVRVPGMFVLLAIPITAAAQLPGETRESARPLVEEGVPRTEARAIAALAPASKQWIFGSGASFAESATTLSSNVTLSMTGATKFELRGAYTRRDPDGLEGVNGVGGYVKLFLPESWTGKRAAFAAIADGRWDIDVAKVWSVSGAMDLSVSDHVLVGGTLGYNEKQPDEGSSASGFVPAVSVAAIPVTGTEVRLQHRLSNDFDGEDRTELSVSHKFKIGGGSAVSVRGSIAKHGIFSTGFSIFP